MTTRMTAGRRAGGINGQMPSGLTEGVATRAQTNTSRETTARSGRVERRGTESIASEGVRKGPAMSCGAEATRIERRRLSRCRTLAYKESCRGIIISAVTEADAHRLAWSTWSTVNCLLLSISHSHSPLPPRMPIFSSTSHVQISGGNFVEVGGDFNIQTNLPSEDIDGVLRGLGRLRNIQTIQPAGDVGNMRMGLERLRLGEYSGRQLVGPVRTIRRKNARMKRPYGYAESSQRPLPQIEFFQPSTADEQSPEDQSSDEGSLVELGVNDLSRRSPMLLDDQSSDEGSDIELDLNDPSRHPAAPRIGYRPDNDLGFPWDRNPTGPATRIRGGTFIGGNVNIIQRHGEAGMPILHRAIAGDAFHDSAERFPQPRCHPETRQKLLDVLWNWACGIEPPRNWTGHDFISKTKAVWLIWHQTNQARHTARITSGGIMTRILPE
ncbi:hypothetical protein B0H19DRAFT_1231310 [Mycena capillaripes]|nr:hypothetical protein B0H19DRAFT_1231310 [Mycena capillaripes]